jgi:hypothetical protein
MDLLALEVAINQGDFQQFVNILKSIPKHTFPKIKLRPTMGRIIESEINAEVYLNYRKNNYSPRTSLKAARSLKE